MVLCTNIVFEPLSSIYIVPNPPIPENDTERLFALKRYSLLDTAPEIAFDEITHLARSLFNVPIAMVSLVDKERQWFKSANGLDITETHRKHAFCAYAILQDDTLVISDALKDERFKENPLVVGEPHIRFYAGAQIVTHDGFPLGTLCVIDHKPRVFVGEDISLLRALADFATNEIELCTSVGSETSGRCLLNRDALTGAYNRRAFKKLLRAECARSKRNNESASLAIFSFDQYVNETRKQGAKSECSHIKFVYSVLKSQLRSVDILARISNSKFAIIFPSAVHSNAKAAVQRIQTAMSKELDLVSTKEMKIKVGVSQQKMNQDHRELFCDVVRQLRENRGFGSDFAEEELGYVKSYTRQ